MPSLFAHPKVPLIPGHSTLSSLAHDMSKLKPGQVLRYRATPKGEHRQLQAKSASFFDWIKRARTERLVKQSLEYNDLQTDICSLVPTAFLEDQTVAQAAEAVHELLSSTVVQCRWLHGSELAEKLEDLNRAVIAAEKRQAEALQSRAQRNVEQILQTAEAGDPPSPEQLAKAIFEAPGNPGEEVAFKHKVFEAILNEHAPVNGHYAVGDPQKAAEEREEMAARLEKGTKKLDKNDRATTNLADAFTQLGLSTQRLADYQARCKDALTQEKVDADQLHALCALNALGQSPDVKKAMGSGFHARIKNDDPHPGITLGQSVLIELGSLVNQVLTRLPIPANEMLRNAKAYADAIENPKPQNPPEQYLVAFRGACKEQLKSYEATLQKLLHVAHHLINASEHFPTISAELKQLLQEHGKCLLAVAAAVSDPAQAATLPYVSLCELAKRGQHDPQAALTLLLKAAQAATHPASSPAPATPLQLTVQEPMERRSEPMSTEELDAQLDSLMAKFDQVRAQQGDGQHQDGRADTGEPGEKDPSQAQPSDLDKLLDELEHWDDGKDRPRPTSATVDEHLSEINKLYRSEVPEWVEVPDASKLQQPESPARTQPKHAELPPQRQKKAPSRELSGRRKVKGMRIRKISVDENPRKKLARETSTELKPHLKDLRRQTWASTATSSRLGTDPDGQSADELLEQTLAEMDATLGLSPRSLKEQQHEQDRKSVQLPKPERVHTNSGSNLDPFEQVDELLAQLESGSSLYDTEFNSLETAKVPERTSREPSPIYELPPYEKSVNSPRTSRKNLDKLLKGVDQANAAKTKAAMEAQRKLSKDAKDAKKAQMAQKAQKTAELPKANPLKLSTHK